MLRPLSIALFLVLGWAGAVFASSTRYIVNYSDFKWNDTTGWIDNRSRVFVYPRLDSLVLVFKDAFVVRNSGDTNKITIAVSDGSGHLLASGIQSPVAQAAALSDECKGDRRSRLINSHNRLFYRPPEDSLTKDGKTLRPVYLVGYGPWLDRTFGAKAMDSRRWYVGWGCNYETSNEGSGLRVYTMHGPAGSDACSVPSSAYCAQCAWPYKSSPDTAACGCRVSVGYYDQPNKLMAQCYAYCNSTSINGNQSVLDQRRSNFDASIGAPVCACSEFTSQKTVYRPTTSCPAGTSPDISTPADSGGLQKIEYDPTTKPDSLRNGSGSGSGSGGGTGKFDSLMNQHLSRIDSILGNFADTAKWRKIDSANGSDTSGDGAAKANAYKDTANIRGSISGVGGVGDTAGFRQALFTGPTGSGWSCTDLTYLDTSISITIPRTGITYTDTLRVSRWLAYIVPWEQKLAVLLTVLAMIMPCAAIATGGDKEGI